MKRIITLFVSCACAALVSCNKAEDNTQSRGYGSLNVDLVLPTQTKSALDVEDLTNTATVNIYKANHKGLVRTYKYADMPSPFYLAADSYRVDVEAGEMVKESPCIASWDQKSYKGSKEFAIVAGQVTNVEVEAFVHNAVTNISFDPTIAENFAEGYTFTIGLDSEDAATQLVYDASKSGADGYFIIDGIKSPSFTWTFTGTLLKDGTVFTKTATISNELQTGKVYKMNLKYTVKDGDIDFSLMVDYTTDIIDDTIIFEPLSVGLSKSQKYEIWATSATVHADVDPTEYADAVVEFAYSSNGSEWTSVLGINDNDGTYHTEFTGLQPATEYSYKLVVDGEDVGEPMQFVTESAPALPNSSFEYVSKVASNDFYKFYDPDCGVEGATTKFWASGNGDEESTGSLLPGTMGAITVPVTDEYYPDDGGKQSILAKTIEISVLVIKKLAAGNLFTGQFVETVGTEGGKVNFGRPFEGRPKALKLWAKYTTATLDYTGKAGDVTLSSSDLDRAQIKVAIGTWSPNQYGGNKVSPICVNTTDVSTFVDFYTDANTVANGDVIIYQDGYDVNRKGKTESTTSEWKEYIIPIDYRNLTTVPTHIVISCSASQYGDYFIGSKSSRLWLDAFELVY